ncbi:hypothetical protein MMC07_008715, partial [Pseudocyphellaria aurata]|nr:hypothetical protein [Pseudocyphellaria aurata]
PVLPQVNELNWRLAAVIVVVQALPFLYVAVIALALKQNEYPGRQPSMQNSVSELAKLTVLLPSHTSASSSSENGPMDRAKASTVLCTDANGS